MKVILNDLDTSSEIFLVVALVVAIVVTALVLAFMPVPSSGALLP